MRRGAPAAPAPYQCFDDPHDLLLTSALSVAYFALAFAASRALTPLIAPVTYARLGKTRGQCSYWDESVASAANGLMAPVLAAVALWRAPSLMTSPDAFLCTPDSCRTVIYFMSWIVYDLLVMLWHIRDWPHTGAMMVHHVSAIAAWALYLEGGYGHAINLVGLLCELTGPTMNMRYFLSEAEMKSSTLYMVNGLAFVLVWLAVRILFAIPAGIFIIYNQHSSLLALPLWRHVCFALFFLVGCCLNCFWGQKLLVGALKILRPKKTKEA